MSLTGAKVSDTIRKGIIDIAPYQNDSSLLMVGNVAALSGLWHSLMLDVIFREYSRNIGVLLAILREYYFCVICQRATIG